MHARYIGAWGFVVGLVALLAPACTAAMDSTAPENARTAEVQEADAPIDLTKRFVCKGLDIVDCMMRCGQEGTACTPRRKHPHNAAAGDGDLYACRTSWPKSCDYRFANGDRCFFFQKPEMIRCLHTGG